MSYPVAMIPYANMAPYRASGCPKGCRFVPLVPAASVAAIREGRVLAAALPVAALPGLGDAVRPVGRFGIAARRRSLSVLVFSDRPFDALRPGDAIDLTTESATSVRLLRLLLEDAVPGGPPALPPFRTPAAGVLVIGDRALAGLHHWRRARFEGVEPGPFSGFDHVADLAQEWHRRRKLPFVFARWVVRRDAPPDALAAIRDWLERFREREAEWVASAVPEAARRTRLPHELLERYFTVIRRSLTPADLAGQQAFLEAIQRPDKAVWPEGMPPSATAA